MKCQNFANKNDFFDYDLVLELMEYIDGVHRFVLVAMRTPDDGGNHRILVK